MLEIVKKVLRTTWHWFKLILGISFIGGAIGMFSERHDELDKTAKVVFVIILSIIFIGMGILFLRSFVKNQRKINNDVIPLFWQSSFYAKYPKISKLILKGRFNGTGSSAYTYNLQRSDGSIERIMWLSIAFIPIIPMIQHRVKLNRSIKKRRFPFLFVLEKSSFAELEKTQLNKRLIVYTYLFYYCFILPALILPIILFLSLKDELNQYFEGVKYWQLFLGYLIFGIILMFLIDMWNTRYFLKKNQGLSV